MYNTPYLETGRKKHGHPKPATCWHRSEEHTSELQSQSNLVCRLLLEKTNITKTIPTSARVSITNSTIASSKANPRRSRQPHRQNKKLFLPAKTSLQITAALLSKKFNL